MQFYSKKKNGFTLIEMILASAMSAVVVTTGIALLQLSIKGNKYQESSFNQSKTIEEALELVQEEVKKGKRIIDNKNEILSLKPYCKIDFGIFLFGIDLPDLAFDDIEKAGGGHSHKKSKAHNCPIIYSIRRSDLDEENHYVMERFGPTMTDTGLYGSTIQSEYTKGTLIEGITEAPKTRNQIVCPENWRSVKVREGVQFCVDKYNKAIELFVSINKSNNHSKSPKVKLPIVSSLGAFSRVGDGSVITNISSKDQLKGSQICIGRQCCWLGVCVKSRKITFMMDTSESMSADFQYTNCINVKDTTSSCTFTKPRIQGLGLFEIAKTELRQQIKKLPTIDQVKRGDEIWLQVIAFDDKSYFLFPNGPQKLTRTNKNMALRWISNLEPKGNTNPWEGLCNSLQSTNVGQIMIVTNGIPQRFRGSCLGVFGNYSDIILDYNATIRSKSTEGSAIIDSISLYHNFCSNEKNQWGLNWLGKLSSSEESKCHHVY